MNGKQWQRRQILFLLSGAIGSLALHSCNSSTSSSNGASEPTSTEASLAIVTWIGYTPLYIAQEKGFYKEAGLDLKMQVFGSNVEANAAFRAGRTDAITLVPSETLTLAATDKAFRVVYVVDLSSGGDGILARNKITDIAAFKGQKIAVEQGAVSHFFLLQAMTEAGLTEQDVTLVNLAPDAAASAYQAGQVDIAVSYAPFLFTANSEQKDGRIIYDSSKLKYPTALSDLILFDEAFIEQNPQAIEAFIRGNLKALEFLNSNRAEGLEIAAKQLGLTASELDEQLKSIKLPNLAENVEMLSDPNSDLYLLKPMADLTQFLQSQGKIQQAPDLDRLLEPKFVKAIAS
ncbi:ABC transporter substrate-binding protein [Microcoleus sp. FACHB-1515]|uniref:ABC transporter substrate-binding protein n=1 Tax=Cyanophyceae TaxID=3028117 RepID=UPI0016866BD5|nr:ABC transporter substrate-binding protein [Microcoleus sp. FACHB-1515]MBD2091005.1 ABC transporter substrate-binding protein [Microcoleus sp. FACHB-1515]